MHYLTYKQVAERLGVSLWTVKRRVRLGEIPVHRLGATGRLARVSEADLDAWAARHRSEPAARQA